jgi:hypothetical protein
MFTQKGNDQDPKGSQRIERGRGRPRGAAQQGLATAAESIHHLALACVALRMEKHL